MSDISLADTASESAARAGRRPALSLWAGAIAQAAPAWNALEARLMLLSDWLNPILVKETRQALKSWQFTLTFMLLLAACWTVTIGGVAMIGPSIYYAAGGGELLRAYYAILSLPLLVVVPFAAFHSLAAEREDNTYDLLSITMLRPRQIISGKLASSVVQMIVLYSAIMPCLAFTYLLRGIDAPTIALLLIYTFFASLGLSMMGLLLATLSKLRHSQLVLSVGFVALLLGAFAVAQEFASLLVRGGYQWIENDQFWIAHFALASFYLTSFALAYFAATGMITFATENRSTPLRIIMLLQQASLVGWTAYVWISGNFNSEYVVLLAVASGGYWFFLGSMLNGERSEISHRAMRSLPRSTLGRVFLTWLNPGPATGYMFAVANLTAILLICLAAHVYSGGIRSANSGGSETLTFLALGWSYVVAYLGLGRLVVALLRRFTEVTMFASALLHLLLFLAGTGIPICIQWMSVELQDELYSYLQITNPLWTLSYVLNYGPTPEDVVLLLVIPAAALCVLLFNLPGVLREAERVRSAPPPRVVEDEAALRPPPDALPRNPWE